VKHPHKSDDRQDYLYNNFYKNTRWQAFCITIKQAKAKKKSLAVKVDNAKLISQIIAESSHNHQYSVTTHPLFS